MPERYIVELEEGVYLGGIHNDGREPWITNWRVAAGKYATEAAAKGALTKARRYKSFAFAKIIEEA